MYIYLTRCDIDRGYVGNPKDVGGKCERSDGKYEEVVPFISF